MKKKLVGIFVCMLLIATAIPAVGTIENDNPTMRETYDDHNNLIKQVIESGVLSNNDWLEEDKLLASDGAASDWFGGDVSIDGDSAIIGAYGDDDNGGDSGSAYVFTRTGSVWTEQAKLIASDGAADDRFGETVSIDGDSAIIGAYKDDDNGGDSGSAYVFIKESENQPPNAPTITGKTSVKAGVEYCWTFHSEDPDGDQIKYIIDWDDGTTTETECYPSCTPVEVCHTYNDQGTYVIKAKAKECTQEGLESDWSELVVTVPRTRATYNSLLLRFLEQFPLLNRLLYLIK